jgi:transitional endoplasmic reticulum ATPase
MAEQSIAARFTVGDARLRDVGEPIARMSSTAMTRLALRQGDRIQISGKSELVVQTLASGTEDDGLDLIRLDAGQRRRIGIDLGDTVDVHRYLTRVAQRIRLIAIGDIQRSGVSAAAVRDAMEGGQLMVGDSFAVTPEGRVFEARLSLLGIQLASVAGSSSDARALMLRVHKTEPDGVVEVGPKTEIDILQAGEEDT